MQRTYISDVSYSQGETFSFTLLGDGKGQTYTSGKHKLCVRVKVIQALIHTNGKVVNVHTIVKNIRDRATEIIKGKICINFPDSMLMNLSVGSH